jgi:hypothetical protein
MTDYAELKRLAQAATRGEWEARDSWVCPRGYVWASGYPPVPSPIASLDDGEYIGNPNAERDAAFIAAACPDVVLAMIAEIERLRATPTMYRHRTDGGQS